MQDIRFADGQLTLIDNIRDHKEEIYQTDKNRVVREVIKRDGTRSRTTLNYEEESASRDDAERYDLAWLKRRTPPKTKKSGSPLRLADMFCGCGGLSLGIFEACRALNLSIESVLAADVVPEYLEVYGKNFHPAFCESRPIESFVDSPIGTVLSKNERGLKKLVKQVSILVGGPPCQGNSDLNNYTRRNDPKNSLFGKMARLAQILDPEHVIIENVPGVRHDKGRIFDTTIAELQKLGYRVDAVTIYAEKVGVPQRRHRTFVLASHSTPLTEGSLDKAIDAYFVPERSVQWACEDLLDIEDDSAFNGTTEFSEESKKRVDWLFDNDKYDLPDRLRPDCHRTKAHTYTSVYGRLYWNRPAWTITTGFPVMGQGRFIHPIRRRMITPHEAARIQFIPDYFEFGERSRKEYAKMIGNAVPPKLSYVVALELLR